MHWIVESLRMSGIMAWEILWGLMLGFLLSAGRGFERRDVAFAAGRSPAHDSGGLRTGRGFFVLFLCGGGAGAFDVS